MVLPSKRKRGRERFARRQQQRHVGEDTNDDSVDANDNAESSRSNSKGDTYPMAVLHQWSFEEGHVGIVLTTLSFLGVTELVEKKQVCKKWQQLCTQAIDNKCPSPKNFKTNQELCDAVRNYCSNEPEKIEVIAVVYGYPINKWRVQDLEDFSWVFAQKVAFDEDISSWDLSNATDMRYMFYYATSFNQSLESWDTSKVTVISSLFYGASSFNQPLSTWDTSTIVNMSRAFTCATAFNQSLRSWAFHNDVDTFRMLAWATSYDQELPDALDPDVVYQS